MTGDPRADAITLLLTLTDTRPDVERAEALIRGGIDWDLLLAQATRHRVLPLVARNLRDGNLFTPSAYGYATMDVYLGAYEYHRHRNEALRDEFSTVAGALDRAGLSFALRKGLLLATRYYRDLGVRPMMDIDLLVDRESGAAVVDALAGLGYSTGKVSDNGRVIHPLPRDEELFWRLHTNVLPPLFRLTGDSTVRIYNVDLSRELSLPGSGMQISTREVLSRARTVTIGTVDTLAAGPEDLVLDLCAHTFKESTTLRYLHRLKHQRLIQYSDLREVLRAESDTLSWDALIRRAQGYRATAALYFTLSHLEAMWPGSVPAAPLAELGVGLDPSFLDRFGALDLDEPMTWDTDFRTRMFDQRSELPLPRGASAV
ncbi:MULTISPECIES: nucleotidyltransferase domain-containing protein [Streptomyces]|uniref:nucleotidyltransferase domain-containing protein n=1 Tax=Streptomyces TaxID=1883 RepID=UPI0015E15FF2|nr:MULTISPECIES: nucleotidyltransferase family protein [Streptomyces]MCX4713023.1 nucleotidyltransferase family protein [Streptomyces griseus]QXR00647.1 nucleotidyltransferase family protein [Streptomyces sp. WY228]